MPPLRNQTAIKKAHKLLLKLLIQFININDFRNDGLIFLVVRRVNRSEVAKIDGPPKKTA